MSKSSNSELRAALMREAHWNEIASRKSRDNGDLENSYYSEGMAAGLNRAWQLVNSQEDASVNKITKPNISSIIARIASDMEEICRLSDGTDIEPSYPFKDSLDDVACSVRVWQESVAFRQLVNSQEAE